MGSHQASTMCTCNDMHACMTCMHTDERGRARVLLAPWLAPAHMHGTSFSCGHTSMYWKTRWCTDASSFRCLPTQNVQPSASLRSIGKLSRRDGGAPSVEAASHLGTWRAATAPAGAARWVPVAAQVLGDGCVAATAAASVWADAVDMGSFLSFPDGLAVATVGCFTELPVEGRGRFRSCSAATDAFLVDCAGGERRWAAEAVAGACFVDGSSLDCCFAAVAVAVGGLLEVWPVTESWWSAAAARAPLA